MKTLEAPTVGTRFKHLFLKNEKGAQLHCVVTCVRNGSGFSQVEFEATDAAVDVERMGVPAAMDLQTWNLGYADSEQVMFVPVASDVDMVWGGK